MKSNLIIVILMLAFFISCEGERVDYTIINRSINVTARIEGSKTRAANDTWSEGDVIGIYMFSSGKELSEESVLNKNAKYTTEGDGFFTPVTPASDIKLPIDDSKVDFIAYYPQGTVNASFDYSIDFTKQENQEAIDFMFADNAKGLDKSSNVVNFNFSHQLAKIIVNLVKDDGTPLSDDLSVSINGMNTKGKFSLINKSLSSTTKGNIKMKVSGNSAEAIVLPSANLSTFSLVIENGLEGYTYNLTEAENITSFEAGYKYTYNITFDTRQTINSNATIDNWTEGPTENIYVSQSFNVYTPVGSGTKEDPYIIQDVLNLKGESGVWAIGYIVGYYKTAALSSFTNDLTDEIGNTKIAIAADPNETVPSKTAPVQLPSGNIRDALNLKDNPDNLGKLVLIRGTLKTYNGGPGINPTNAFEFVSP